jgi:hypothetical protein
MDAIARLAVYPQVQQDSNLLQRAEGVIDLVCQHLHIGPPPEPDPEGMVTFVQIGPEDLIEGLTRSHLSGVRRPFYVPQPPS